jgi:hypothetical protein
MRTGDEYTESVFEFLDKAETDKSFTIANLVKKENRERFIEAVKLYIRSYNFGGGVEFNTDYTKIRKFEIPEEAIKGLWEYNLEKSRNKSQTN